MIRDVKSYFRQVGKRLSQAFEMQDFDREAQIYFWTLASEMQAQDDVPSFRQIARWIDLAYRAPTHFVYRKEGEQLKLFKRHIIPQNLEINQEHKEEENTAAFRNLRRELDNLAPKISYHDSFQLINISSFNVGKCQHFPIFSVDKLWGIYCAGPYVEMPQSLQNHIAIVSKILSRWFVKRHEVQSGSRYRITEKVQKNITLTESQNPQFDETFYYLLNNLVKIAAADGGILTDEKGAFNMLQSVNTPDEILEPVKKAAADDPHFNLQEYYQQRTQEFKTQGFQSLQTFQVGSDEAQIFFYALFKHAAHDEVSRQDLDFVGHTAVQLQQYQHQQENFVDKLLDTYYRTLRQVEKRTEKTFYHTARVVAFCKEYGQILGFDADEVTMLNQTARLHDIGYLCLQKRSMGGETEHPQLGKMMVESCGLSPEVVMGIAAHQEWIDGSGSPSGLRNEEIPWTAKVISIVEFVVQFIEEHREDDSKSDSEWEQSLTEALFSRADRQFDMLLVPAGVELIQSLGWNECSKLGEDHEN